MTPYTSKRLPFADQSATQAGLDSHNDDNQSNQYIYLWR